VDDLVTRLVLARLLRADARDLLARDNPDELTSPHREAGAIGELMAADRGLHREGLLTGLGFAGGRRKVSGGPGCRRAEERGRGAGRRDRAADRRPGRDVDPARPRQAAHGDRHADDDHDHAGTERGGRRDGVRGSGISIRGRSSSAGGTTCGSCTRSARPARSVVQQPGEPGPDVRGQRRHLRDPLRDGGLDRRPVRVGARGRPRVPGPREPGQHGPRCWSCPATRDLVPVSWTPEGSGSAPESAPAGSPYSVMRR
jgi:hypothetical protein